MLNVETYYCLAVQSFYSAVEMHFITCCGIFFESMIVSTCCKKRVDTETNEQSVLGGGGATHQTILVYMQVHVQDGEMLAFSPRRVQPGSYLEVYLDDPHCTYVILFVF
jgi:hypothetical protein